MSDRDLSIADWTTVRLDLSPKRLYRGGLLSFVKEAIARHEAITYCRPEKIKIDPAGAAWLRQEVLNSFRAVCGEARGDGPWERTVKEIEETGRIRTLFGIPVEVGEPEIGHGW